MRAFVLFCFVLTYSCSSSGPCDYAITETHAKVLQIDTLPNGNTNIQMQVYGSSLSDQQTYLHELKNTPTDTAFVRRNKIKVGVEYSITVSDRINGTCTERIVSFNHRFR